MTRDQLLVASLQAAVPMWIAEAERLPAVARDALLQEWRADAAEVVPAEGDNVNFGGHKHGETAKAFNSLARGLAAISHAPGGVRVFGLLWCAAHTPGGVPADRGLYCAGCRDQTAGGVA